MNPVEVDTYLARLAFELEKRGLPAARILEETEGHLVDAIDRGVQKGLAPDAAAADAVARFGEPEAVAMNFAAERYRLRDRLLVVAATAFAYAGMVARRAAGAFNRPAGSSGFHDRSTRGFQFVLKSKKGWVNPELLGIVSSPDTDLVPFLQRVAPGPLGPLGVARSVTLVEDASHAAKPTRTYRAVFGTDPAIVCTVVLASDGTGVAVHWTRASSTASSTPDLSARQ